ncbi:hypothetical protein TKK_0010932 [Trichogramma kaykai]|uniref:Nodal modulator 2 n=1 Tax=Trichogramma kaykai TaxID=54128 RepID=A0ABD2WVP2_9HYME
MQILILLALGLVSFVSATDEILGCGGFVKSHADIDFSRITVKLFTKSGSLKDHTECAPNTGYYFLPIYDKGEYYLKLEPPTGWSFEPTEVLLNIDGSGEDLCSQGSDINFVFKGFGITGKVVTSKTKSGPKGISVSLYDEHNTTLLGSTSTSENGIFSFTPVQPGKYILVASHPIWHMEKHSTSVIVKEGNTEIKDGDLSVFGFDVGGRVTTTEGEPVGKVTFLLYGNGQAKYCATKPVEGFDSKKKPLCHILSDENGRFSFPALSPGEYTLIPHYAGSKTKFDVKPSELPFSVVQDSLILSQEFKVTGFTISGKVMASIKPAIPLAGAKVFLSKKQIAVTDKNGAYKTDNIKAKQYILYAEANDMLFEEMPVKVMPSNPELPIITPKSYKVSGKISSTTKISLENRKMLVKSKDSTKMQEIKINPNTGEWSVYLAPDTYHLSVIVDEHERSKGLQFFPVNRVIDVVASPIKDVNFLQLKATLKGSIVCLPDKDSKETCGQTQITLRMVDNLVESKTIKAKDGEYIFEDVLPGQYEVIIDSDTFCWDSSNHFVTIVSEKPPNVPPFRQTGYSVTFISSHNTKVEYTVPSQQNKKMYLQLLKGSTRHCITMPGKYEFFPKGCHTYAKDSFSWNTNEQTPIILSSSEHTQTGKIISAVSVEGVSVKIEGESDGQSPIIQKNLKAVKDGDKYKYMFSFEAVTGETYVISPSSEALLFDPPSIKVIGPEDCKDDVAIFRAEQGKIIIGSISPPLEGVSVQIFGVDKEVPVHTLMTQKDGSFKIGPLDASIEYSIEAKKEGYVLKHDDGSTGYKFLARKLAEINVQAIDVAGSVPLQGVLISLSGSNGGTHSYRKNLITMEDGSLTFYSLSPGEYYLRPTMKEYRFEPASKMIKVEEGKSVKVSLQGRRVAFSAYGTVSCLNGEPEAGLVVEAKGQAECSHLQEEVVTKADGSWRIRGLEPKCMYTIRVKLEDTNIRGLRAIPSSIAVQATQDVYDIKLMALQPVSRTDVSVRVISTHPENYRTLKVKLCREDQADSPIHVLRLDNNNHMKSTNSGVILHFPPLQIDGKKYFVQLETTLSRATHTYDIKPFYFTANSSFKYAELHFNGERHHDHGDGGQITYLPLPLILIVTIAFYNREALSAWLNTTVEKWSRKSTTKSSQNQQNLLASSDPRLEEQLIAEQLKNINAKSIGKKVKPRKA